MKPNNGFKNDVEGMTENNRESFCQENIMYIITNFFQSVSVFQRPIFFLEDSSALLLDIIYAVL
jgi:hypothetical protein